MTQHAYKDIQISYMQEKLGYLMELEVNLRIEFKFGEGTANGGSLFSDLIVSPAVEIKLIKLSWASHRKVKPGQTNIFLMVIQLISRLHILQLFELYLFSHLLLYSQDYHNFPFQ